jgi:cyclic beta-1,2-glucan synthetase
MVAPEEACRNLERLAAEGFEGRYGFYEAIDYTPSRLPPGQSRAVVRSFMAHHQGMSLLSLAHLLLDRPMQKRFASVPAFQATMLLLQERIPKATAFYAHTTDLAEHQMASSAPEMPIRVFTSPDTPNPEVQLLSNGRYHVMVTNAGGGYSRWKDLAVTRWREDTTCDNWGTFCYIRDVTSGEFWSTACQPTRSSAKQFEAIFSEGRAEFRSHDHGYDTHTEIAVSPEDDIELRRVRITNRGRTRRAIDVTSYAEVVLAPPPRTHCIRRSAISLCRPRSSRSPQRAILCTRRPRSQRRAGPWMFHLMAVHGAGGRRGSYETDRLRFIGRGNTIADPQALRGDHQAGRSGSEGSVLDPIVAIRHRITLEPEESATINMVSGIGETRDAAGPGGKIPGPASGGSRLRSGLDPWPGAAAPDQCLRGRRATLWAPGRFRSSTPMPRCAPTGVLIKNRRGQSGLWGYAISGDLPIVLLRIEIRPISMVRQLVQAHAYWRLKGLAVDLVIWNEDRAGYRQLLHEEDHGADRRGHRSQRDRSARRHFRKTGRPDIQRGPHPDPNGRSRHHHDSRGTLAEQLNRPAGGT